MSFCALKGSQKSVDEFDKGFLAKRNNAEGREKYFKKYFESP
jgi:hypothetical protein